MWVPISPTQLAAPETAGSVRQTAMLVCVLLPVASSPRSQSCAYSALTETTLPILPSAIISFITLDIT